MASSTHHLPRIIAVCGLMRCGKDTVADYLTRKYGYENIKIAEGLKKTLGVLFGFSRDQLEGDTKDVVDPFWEITPRKAMQFFGTEVMQYKIQELLPNCNRTFWVSTVVNSIQNKLQHNPSGMFVISDLRFIHEWQYIKKKFPEALIIKVERPCDCGGAINTEAIDHVSEQEYKSIIEDVKLVNDSSLTEFYAKINAALTANQML